MKLSVKSSVSSPFKWSAPTTLQAGNWVKLQELPSPYSYDEALLLCEHSDTEWVVWIPDQGEMILPNSQLSVAV